MVGDLLKILIPIITVVISVLAAIFTTSKRIKAEIIKMRNEMDFQFSKTLFEKRLSVYPELVELMSDYSKKIDYGKNTIENLRELQKLIDQWNSKNSIFFITRTSLVSAKFRRYLTAIFAQAFET
jgi:hypothetical protein